jgi:hypothetical protein
VAARGPPEIPADNLSAQSPASHLTRARTSGTIVDMAEDPSIEQQLQRVLTGRDDVVTHLTDAHAAAQAAVSPRILELCRARVAALLGGPPPAPDTAVSSETYAALAQWPTSALFDTTDRACLAFAEQFVIDVASLDDATAFAVRDALGDQGFADFVSALLVIEQRQRLHLMWDHLLQETTP